MRSQLILLALIASFSLIFTGCDKKPKTDVKTRLDSATKENVKNEKAGYKKITLATASVTGVYHPVGRLISRIVNAESDKHKMEMATRVSKGSLYNVKAILRGDAEFALVQSDIQYQASRGQKEWREKGPQKKLRSICSLYPEPITLVALESSGIKEIKDIKGKRVNLGIYGSGNLENSISILNSLGMNAKDVKAEYLYTMEASRKLAQGAIDAFFYTVGHPNAEIKEISYIKKVMIIPIQGPKIEGLIEQYSYYVKSSIDKKYYPYMTNKEKNIPSLAVQATLVTSTEVSNAIVHAVTERIFENINELKSFHPALSSLKKENMFKGLSASLHPGAAAYYKEKGLDKFIPASLLR